MRKIMNSDIKILFYKNNRILVIFHYFNFVINFNYVLCSVQILCVLI